MNFIATKAFLRTAATTLFFIIGHAAVCLGAPSDSVIWAPAQLASGSPCLFTVELQDAAVSVAGKWQGQNITFFQVRGRQAWYALAGVDVEVAEGSYPLTIEAAFINGKTQALHRDVPIAAAPYEKITLHIPDKFIQPDAAALKKIAADKIVKERVFAKTAPKPEWTGNFLPPLKLAPQSDSFGTRRVFNGTLASVHRGLDYHAKTGTPVSAVNAGRVVLARLLYFEGNCVMIDHGMGLMTVYMHLSKFRVKEGDKVHRGQVIALSGGTGRATGPHLHLGVRWQGASMDPVKLFALNLPIPR
jgi:murein DD-endopeptidase MepM/ murein hydrolase activator NlpD